MSAPMRPVFAAWPYLVHDVNPITAGSDTRFLGRAGNGFVLAADDGVQGRELWYYSVELIGYGQAGRGKAVLLKDILPGPESSDPRRLAVHEDVVYFTAFDPAHGREIWRTDGTASGTRLVKDIRSGSQGSSVSQALVVGDHLFFGANDGTHGAEVWRTDGSAAGTLLVEDIRPGEYGSRPSLALVQGGHLLFLADDGTHGQELWRLDPDTQAPLLLKDIDPGPGDSSLSNLTAVGDLVFMTAQTAAEGLSLWRSDGTPEGTLLVQTEGATTWSELHDLVGAGSRLFFRALDDDHGSELWSSDGTAAGTTLFRDLYPGRQSSYPRGFLPLGDGLLFTATDPVHGRQLRSTADPLGDSLLVLRFASVKTGGPLIPLGSEVLFWMEEDTEQILWRTDGTPRGTAGVRIFGPYGGLSEFALYSSLQLGGYLYLVIRDELWRTDGTGIGTGLVKRWGVYEHGYEVPGRLHRLRDTLLLVADDALRGAELWRSDGTEAGTRLAADINLVSAGSDPEPLLSMGDHLFFAADGGARPGLWRTDGTDSGTVEVLEGPTVREVTQLGERILFAARDLYVSDGTTAGTNVLWAADGSQLRFPKALTVLGDVALFHADRYGLGRELWRTDGTRAGTHLVRDIAPGTASSTRFYAPSPPAVAGGYLYFVASDYAHGSQIWRSDGTTVGTTRVTDLPAASGPCCFYTGPRALTAVGEKIFFVNDDDEHGRELWRTDGSTAGTVMVQDLYEGPLSSYPGELTAIGNTLFFSAEAPDMGRALWKVEPSEPGATLVRDIYPGLAPPDILAWPYLDDFTELDGTLYFTANDLVHGHELWVSDGTTVGTRLVRDIFPGPDWSRPRGLRAVGGTLFFNALGPGDHGREAWRSDGTEAGTVEIDDIWPGAGSSEPTGFTELNGLVLFAADDSFHGRELWALPLPQSPCDGEAELTLERRAVVTAEAHEACDTIRVGPELSVLPGGRLELQARHRVELRDGLRIDRGGTLGVQAR